jgi:hypothetical protein
MSEKNVEGEDYSLDKGYMSIHEVLAANGVNQRMLVESLDREEAMEKPQTEDEIEADIKSHKEKTQLAKEKLIKEMKFGLGNQMLKDPTKIEIIKKPWYIRLGNFFKNIFTKF